VHFSGYDWQVSAGDGLGPGPNSWDANNVWTDADGYLHLKLTHRGGRWYCAEAETTTALGFGRYQFEVAGPIDRLDPNVVLGLFDYPTPDIGPDGTNEIDIEFSRWGDPGADIGNYTVWPVQAALAQAGNTFSFSLDGGAGAEGEITTQRYTRAADHVLFQSLLGAHEDDSAEFGRWDYRPAAPATTVPQTRLPVHVNLWLFGGQPPTDGNDVEIVIRKFEFTPA
jgi:hypothetical protein